MISHSFGEPMFSSSHLEGIAPRLIVVHQSDRKHVTDKDVTRLESQGYVVLFVEFTNKVRVVEASDTEEAP